MPDRGAAFPVLHHVNLKTRRLDQMIAWYGTVAGLAVVFKWPGGAFLTNDGANHRLVLLTSPRLSDDAQKLLHTGIHHLAFESRPSMTCWQRIPGSRLAASDPTSPWTTG